MKVNRVRVRNYKGVIDSDWFEINHNLTTLVGKNESGKTSLLEAINFFSHTEQCDTENIHNSVDYSEGERIPIIHIEFELDNSDPDVFHQIAKETSDGHTVGFVKYSDGFRSIDGNINVASSQWERARAMYLAQRALDNFQDHLNSEIDTLPSSFLNKLFYYNDLNLNDIIKLRKKVIDAMNTIQNEVELSDTLKSTAHNTLSDIRDDLTATQNETIDIFTYLPDIVYYEDITAIKDTIDQDKLDSGAHPTIQKVFEQSNIDYKNISGDNIGTINRKLISLEKEVTDLISSSWRQKSVDISLRHGMDNKFRVLLSDVSLSTVDEEGDLGKETSVKREHIPPSQRSRGFQWFLSFCLRFSADVELANRSKLILLDDPAVYLHPEGKKDCLNAIAEMPEEIQVMYSTHSPFLIDEKHPECLRIVEDKPNNIGTTITTDFRDAEGIALEPIRNALGLTLGDYPFVSQRMILVEGISDYYVLTAVAHYYARYHDEVILDPDDVAIMPVDGADKMTTTGKWVAAEDFSYVLLLDNDTKGRSVKNKIDRHHREIDLSFVVLIDTESHGDECKVEIEDMFDGRFYIDCGNEVYNSLGYEFENIMAKDIELNGEDIVSKIEQQLMARGIDEELRKRQVTEKIKNRLNENRDIEESNVRRFKPLLGKLKSLTDNR